MRLATIFIQDDPSIRLDQDCLYDSIIDLSQDQHHTEQTAYSYLGSSRLLLSKKLLGRANHREERSICSRGDRSMTHIGLQRLELEVFSSLLLTSGFAFWTPFHLVIHSGGLKREVCR